MTLKRIADHAGVSRSTVSLVLRDSPLVAARTRERVRAAMSAVGYLYDRGAARLRTGRSQTVGLVVAEITNPFHAEMIAGMEAVLDDAGWIAFLANTGDQPTRQARFIQRMREHGVDGIALCPAEATPRRVLDVLRETGLPFLQVLREVGGCAGDYVGPDYRRGMAAAVEHLVAAGHRRIGYIRSNRDTSAVRERLDGLHATLLRHLLRPGPLVACPTSRVIAAAVTTDVLKSEHPPTALICHNDVIALGVLSGLSRHGLRPGADIAVIGFDDIAEAATSVPALSTIATRPSEVGATAAALLLRRIAAPWKPTERIILPCHLTLRDT